MKTVKKQKLDDLLLDKRVVELNRIIVGLETLGMWFTANKMKAMLKDILEKEAA